MWVIQGCSVSISEKDVFRPNDENRRDQNSTLDLDDEDQLPASVSLTHTRHPSEIGSIAFTFAETDSDRLIVHCGGNSSDRKTDGVGYINKLVSFGDVLIFDYPGYGDSEGTPSAENFEVASRAVVEQVQQRQRTDVVVWGHSLGGFVCAPLVKMIGEPVKQVVFEVTAQNAQQIADAMTPWYAEIFTSIEIGPGLDQYDNAKSLSGFSGDVLVLGAGKDEALPSDLSQQLVEGLRGLGVETVFHEFPNASHVDIASQSDFHEVAHSFFGTP